MAFSEREGRRCGGIAHRPRLASVVWTLGLLHGCSRSPSTNVLGAYYPDWLFCIVGAVVAAVLIRLLLLRAGLNDWLYPPAIAYPALLALLAFAGWLLFF
ncbi:YtcA family lipoprotein [Cupriavidus sp. CP313]